MYSEEAYDVITWCFLKMAQWRMLSVSVVQRRKTYILNIGLSSKSSISVKIFSETREHKAEVI